MGVLSKPFLKLQIIELYIIYIIELDIHCVYIMRQNLTSKIYLDEQDGRFHMT